ncbi:Di-sulfide bridge nucleocytoplasmic transport domain-containing protein [Tricharina praecox]|uniref:Di-sulfide bridge nucleocytoplasmic transport domain-containing protein n=1 Tax=Tricharina praecox TaxID=43433 RepID=UPI00221FA748|nr:Di-sulfide bridge nucleocytoplasmic transport domain-containing protein [Tricharina praecox]KAI5848145.1 Di-sulfide bridge nucleocytoplasmic transport domain-containing protein [Tricharina praecox]
METRGQESPMDFQWENSSGRVDPNSPFRMNGFQRTLAEETPVKRGTAATHSVFGSSPIKQPVFATPAQTPYTPRTPYRETPHQSRFETPSFRTPRRPFATLSKDSDVFDTPDTESEAPTPDAAALQLLRSTKKTNANSGAISATPGRVTGRGELRRGSNRHSISKPRRRRRTELDQVSDDDDDDFNCSETDYGFASTRKTPRKPKRADGPDWLAMHQRIPVVVSAYLGLFVHASWVALAIYILFACFRVVQQDMAHRVYEAAESVSLHIAECTKNYLQNRCAPDTRVPATEAACAMWEKCMAQDPAKVGRAKVSAATIAEILNGFVNELHWKTIGLFALVVMLCWIGSKASAVATLKEQNHPHPFVAATIPPLASQWTPHHIPSESYAYTPAHQPWATPLLRKGGGGGAGGEHGRTPRRMRDDDQQVVEWK